MARIPELRQGTNDELLGADELVRIANQNFRILQDEIERGILSGGLIAPGSVTLAMLAPEVLANSGDVSGTHPAHTVVGIQTYAIAKPTAGEDAKAIVWDNAGGAWAYAALVTDHGGLTGLGDNDHPQYALVANNLSDLASAAAARSNLGLGSMAVVNDAPSDGTTYGRLNGAWAAAGGGGGGSPPADFDLLTDGVDELVFTGGDVTWIV